MGLLRHGDLVSGAALGLPGTRRRIFGVGGECRPQAGTHWRARAGEMRRLTPSGRRLMKKTRSTIASRGAPPKRSDGPKLRGSLAPRGRGSVERRGFESGRTRLNSGRDSGLETGPIGRVATGLFAASGGQGASATSSKPIDL